MKRKLAFLIFSMCIIFMSIIFFDTIRLVHNRITGAAELDTTVIIVTVQNATCNSTFEAGWNLISIPCIRTQLNFSEVFGAMNDSVISVHQYLNGAADPWLSYNPSLPTWVVQDLKYFNRKSGYWINLDSRSQFFLNSSLMTPNYIFLSDGWESFGYPIFEARNVSDIMSTIIGDYDKVYMYNASDIADPWKEYSWNSSGSDQDLQEMASYHGYWIKMDADGTITVD